MKNGFATGQQAPHVHFFWREERGLAKIRFGDKSIELPRNRLVRIAIGGSLVVLGAFGGWLPILGFWMAPLGLLILSADIPPIRRFNRRVTVAVVSWWKGRKGKEERKAARNSGRSPTRPDGVG
jgi:hypothetical protein